MTLKTQNHHRATRLCTVAVSLAFLASCSDDNPIDDGIDDSRLPQLEADAPDISNGFYVLMADIDNLQNFRHRLGTKKNVKVEMKDADNSPVNISIVTDADTTRHLVLTRKDTQRSPMELESPRVIDFTISLADGTMAKNLKLVCRQVGSSSVSEDDLKFANKIGMGTKIWMDMGNVTYSVLDFRYVEPKLTVTSNLSGAFFEIGGTRYEETMEKMSLNLGASGNGSILGTARKFIFTGAANYSQSKVTHNIKNYETYLGYYQKSMAEAKLNPLWISNMRQDGTLYAVLDSCANDVFNNPGSKLYMEYPNTRDGIFRLLELYGTHVVMQGTFGGSYMFMYARKENAYETSIGHDASASMKMELGSKEEATTWLQAYKAKFSSSPYISAESGGGDYSSDYKEVSDAFILVLSTGGSGAIDINTWESKFSAKDPSEWALISFLTKDSDGDGRLADIREFVLDPDRKAALDKYWEEFLTKQVGESTEDRLVLADFMMKTGAEQHVDGKPESFVGTGPDGKKYIYFPIMANDNNPYSKWDGYALETNQDEYLVAISDKTHYWYYALGYDSSCNGILDIRFSNKEHSGWVRRGNNANEGISVDIHNKQVLVKPGDSATPFEDKVKAVAVTKSINAKKDAPADRIVGSSGGSEKKLPFATTENWNKFNDYWKSYRMYDDTQFYTAAILVHDHPLYVITNCTPLTITNLCFGERNSTGKIQHPKKWGE